MKLFPKIPTTPLVRTLEDWTLEGLLQGWSGGGGHVTRCIVPSITISDIWWTSISHRRKALLEGSPMSHEIIHRGRTPFRTLHAISRLTLG